MTIHYQRTSLRDEAYSVTEEEDDEMDDWLDNCDKCSDCGEPDTGFCACVCAEHHARNHGLSVAEWLAEPRLEARMYDSQRALRQRIRLARKHIIVWQRIVCVHRLITFWRKAAAAPDSKAFERAAKRFRLMAEGR